MGKQSMGEFLGILRKANGYTQQEVAEKLNISNRTLSSWETDRTSPDILLLPAIADLYGVTVDELIRGERGESEKPTELSETALRSARKLQFAKFSLRNVFLTGFSCFGAVLFILAACLNLYSSAPVWLVAIVAVLGGCGVITCTILHIFFYFKAKYGGGIVLNEDVTNDKKGYALALKRKSQTYFLVSAVPFILFVIILAGIYCKVQPKDSYQTYEYADIFTKVTVVIYTHLKTRYLVFLFICLAVGLAMLVTYFVYGNTGLKNIMSETQLQTHKYNKKLAGILCGCSAIPVIVMFAVFLLLSHFFTHENMYAPKYYIYMSTAYVFFILTVAVCTIISCIIYAIKHKKQNYDF